MPKIGDVYNQKEYDEFTEAGYTHEEIKEEAKLTWKALEPKRHKKEDKDYAKEREYVRATSLLKDDAAIDKHFTDRFNPLNKDGSTRKVDKSDASYNAWRRGQAKSINAQTQKEIVEYNKNNNVYGKGQGFIDRVKRGAESAMLEDNMVLRHVSGVEQDPSYVKTVDDARKLDDAYAKSQQSSERQKEVEALEKEYEKAESFTDTVGTGARLLWDKAMNLDEANVAGTVGSMFTPLNLSVGAVTGGAGSLASKAVTSVGKKAAIGAVVGATADTAYNTTYEYQLAKSQGKSDKEAEKASIMGGMTGLAMGTAVGGLGAITTRTKNKIASKISETTDAESMAILESKAKVLEENLEMVEIEAQKVQPIMESIGNSAKNPQEFNQQVISLIPPKAQEIQTSLIINNNQEVSPRFAGNRVRNSLLKSIENPRRSPQQMMDVLQSEGFTVETANAITTAYDARSIDVFDDFVAQKMADSFDRVELDSNVPKKERVETHLAKEEDTQSIVNDFTSNPPQKQIVDEATFQNEKTEHLTLSESPKENMLRLNELDSKVHAKEYAFTQKVTKDYNDAKLSIATQSKKGFVLNPWSTDVRKIAKYHYLRGADNLKNFSSAMKSSLGESWGKVKPMVRKLFEKTYNAVENWSTEQGTRGQVVRSILGRSYAVANDASFEAKVPKKKPNDSEATIDKGDFEVDAFDSAIKNVKDYSLLKKGNKWQEGVDKLFDKMEEGLEYAVNRKFDRKAKETGATKDKLKAMGAKTLRALVAVEKETKVVRDIQNDLMIKTADISRVGNDVKVALDGLSEKDSQGLVRVLNGDKKKTELSADMQKMYERFRTMIDHNANELIALGALDKDSKIEHYVKRYYQKYVDDSENSNVVSKLYHGTVKGRKNLSHEERLKMGMLEDASFVVTNTIVEQRKQILKARLLKQVADQYGKEVEFENSVRISDETIDGSNGKIKKYGALGGKHVPEEVADALKQGETISSSMDFFSKYLFPVVDHIKVNMTVKNPTTHLFNVASNMQIAVLKGDMKNLSEVMLMIKTNPERFKKLVKTANSYGLDSQLDEIEFQVEFDKNAKTPNAMKSILQSAVSNAYMSQGSAIGKGMRKAYDWEDKIFKLASFYGEIKGKTLNHADGKIAFKRATGDYVDYSTAMPWLLRALDKGGVIPFVHYTYKSTPKVAKLILKHPLNFAIMQGALTLGGASLLFNEDNDATKPNYADDNAFDSLANTPLAGKITNLFFVKNWGEVGDGEYTFNYGRSVPGVRMGPLSLDGGFWKSAFNIAFNHEDGLGRKLNSKDSLGTNFGLEDESYGKQGIDKGVAFGEAFLPTAFPLGRYAGRALRKVGGVHKPLNDFGEELGWSEFTLRMLGYRKFDKERHLEEAMKETQTKGIKEGKSKEAIEKELDVYREYADKRDLRYIKSKLKEAESREYKKKNEDDKLYKEIQKMVKVKQGDSTGEIRAYLKPYLDQEAKEGRSLSSAHKKLLKRSIKRASRYYD